MGLPSGVQWASCNIGAEKPSDSGLFFSWGNIEGHSIGEGYRFTQEVYDSTPAAAIDTDLSLSQDAARANLGGPWRMPTVDEFRELYDNCTSIWTTLNGVDGLLFTSNINDNTLFFPAAGFYNVTSLVGRGSKGSYLSSTYISATSARLLHFDSSSVEPNGYNNRSRGFTVRAVVQLE